MVIQIQATFLEVSLAKLSKTVKKFMYVTLEPPFPHPKMNPKEMCPRQFCTLQNIQHSVSFDIKMLENTYMFNEIWIN